jgi:hypothetical protein
MRILHNLVIVQIIIILSILLFTSSCSSIEIIDGLCYNDKDGTYMCEEEIEIPSEPIDQWELCEPWLYEPETWVNCMMIA